MPSPTPSNTAPHIRIEGWDGHVFENATDDDYLGTLVGIDAEGDAVSFSLLYDAGGRFAIVNGQLVVANASLLDYETAPKHDIVVRAMDSKGAYRDQIVTIEVRNVESDSRGTPPLPIVNRDPVVLGLNGDAVSQHVNTGTIVGYVNAVDPDGYALTYSLLDNADGRFAITRGNQIVVADGTKLDYASARSHHVTVLVEDGHGSSHEEVLTINVRNPDGNQSPPAPVPTPPDNAPPDMMMLDGVNVFENSATGVQIGRLKAHDPNGDALSFELLDNADGRFAIVDGFVVVANGANLDYETAHEHHIKVRVSDGHGGAQEAVFTIHVRDVYEGGPTPPPPPPENHVPTNLWINNLTVNENSPAHTIIGHFSAVDVDGDAVSFELLEGGDLFYIDGNALRVREGVVLDFETKRTLDFKVVAVDVRGGISETYSLIVNVLDVAENPPSDGHAPLDIVMSANWVVENSPTKTLVGTLSTLDPDQGDHFTYELLNNADGRFAIENGAIVVADASKIDYETAHYHWIQVKATDSQNHSVIKDLSILVSNDPNDNGTVPPANPEAIVGTDGDDDLGGDFHNHAYYGLAGDDMIVGNVGNDTLDGGAGNDLLFGGAGDDTYIWQPGTGSYDYIADASGFDTLQINALASELTFQRNTYEGNLWIGRGDTTALNIGGYFNSSNPGGQIERLVFSDGTVWNLEQVLAAVNGAPFDLQLQGDAVFENAHDGLPVGYLQATDPDGDNLTYDLIDNAGGRFAIMNGPTGATLYVADSDGLDYEAAEFHHIKVRVTDSHGFATVKDFTIRVMDVADDDGYPPIPPGDNHAPELISLTSGWVAENSVDGFIVGTVKANDQDGDALTYDLLNDAEGRFIMVGNDLRVLDGSRFDDQIERTHTVRVRVTDQHGLSNEGDFIIRVIDRDGNTTPPPPPPLPDNHAPDIIRLTFDWVAENSLNGFIVGTVQATDKDGDALTYKLVDDADGRFVMDGNDLRVLDGSRFDDQIDPTHTVKVQVTDQHGGVTEREFIIRVMDRDGNTTPPVDNHAPAGLFLSGNTIQENAPETIPIGYFTAHDVDGDLLTYTLLDDADGRFKLHDNMLIVKDGSKLDFETNQSHQIKVRVSDGHDGFTDKIFDIVVQDVVENNEPPGPGPSVGYNLYLEGETVAENTSQGTVVGVLEPVEVALDSVTYSLLDDAGGRFEIVGDKIVVKAGANLDFETADSHSVTVQMTWAGHTLDKTFKISVTDIEEDDLPEDGQVIVGGSEASVLTGAAGDDTISGGNGNDKLFGMAGEDFLSGDLGKDVLTGGEGQDIFIFSKKLGKQNIDTITDFSVVDDTIQLSKSIFKAIGKKGVLAKDAFIVGTAAKDAEDRIVYNSKTGKLFYDADGNGDQAAVQFATLAKGLKIANLDFFIV